MTNIAVVGGRTAPKRRKEGRGRGLGENTSGEMTRMQAREAMQEPRNPNCQRRGEMANAHYGRDGNAGKLGQLLLVPMAREGQDSPSSTTPSFHCCRRCRTRRLIAQPKMISHVLLAYMCILKSTQEVHLMGTTASLTPC